MQWPQSRRMFLKNCALFLATPLVLIIAAQFAFCGGQILAMISMGLVVWIAPQIQNTLWASAARATLILDAAGYLMAVLALCLLIRTGDRRLLIYEDPTVRDFALRVNKIFIRRS